MARTRRGFLATAAGTAGAGLLAGCLDDSDGEGGDATGATAQASFFVFGDVASHVAGDAANAELLVPVGQHGHGWEPGPRVREDVTDADLFVHGMDGFQPWVDDVLADLEADDADVATVDVSAGVDLLEPDDGHEHSHGDDHETAHDGENDHGAMDPHFWMDPLRVKAAVDNVQQALADVDGEHADAFATNAEAFKNSLDDLHGRIESVLADASTDVLLVAGHNSHQYFADRYGVQIEALTDLSPDDQPTPRDVERAQDVIETHDLRYVCADPLESQEAAEQLVAETDAEEVLPLTSMPGLTDQWAEEDWGYVEVVENVNLPTLERALEV